MKKLFILSVLAMSAALVGCEVRVSPSCYSVSKTYDLTIRDIVAENGYHYAYCSTESMPSAMRFHDSCGDSCGGGVYAIVSSDSMIANMDCSFYNIFGELVTDFDVPVYIPAGTVSESCGHYYAASEKTDAAVRSAAHVKLDASELVEPAKIAVKPGMFKGYDMNRAMKK